MNLTKDVEDLNTEKLQNSIKSNLKKQRGIQHIHGLKV